VVFRKSFGKLAHRREKSEMRSLDGMEIIGPRSKNSTRGGDARFETERSEVKIL